MPVERWAKDLTESVLGGAPVEIGRRYVHPRDGEIEIISGRYWGEHGISNHWYWRVIATSETHNGYGDAWPEVTS